MAKKIAIIMDDMQRINLAADTTIAIIEAAQEAKYHCYYTTQAQLSYNNDVVTSTATRIDIDRNASAWYQFQTPQLIPLRDFDAILMRTDPPVDNNYLATTHLLSLAERHGARVYNNPQTLRDKNEKLFILEFPELIPETIVTSNSDDILNFVAIHQCAVIKSLNSYAGHGVLILKHDDPNLNALIATMTKHHTTAVLVQTYLPAIKEGDKRILVINNKIVPYIVNRIPRDDDFRGNLGQGASAQVRKIESYEENIVKQLLPHLKTLGLFFVGIDMIGDKITEINITSPTGMRRVITDTTFNPAKLFIEELF